MARPPLRSLHKQQRRQMCKSTACHHEQAHPVRPPVAALLNQELVQIQTAELQTGLSLIQCVTAWANQGTLGNLGTCGIASDLGAEKGFEG